MRTALLWTSRTTAAPDFEAVFDVSPNPYVLLAPDFTILAANEAYLRSTLRSRTELIGRNMFEAFPAGPTDPEGASAAQLRASLARVVAERAPDTLALIHYPIPNGHGFDDRYWSAIHTPILDAAGEVAFILQHTVDVTELHRLRQGARSAGLPAPRIARERLEVDVFRRAQEVQEANRMLDAERLYLRRLFEQAPGFTAVLAGPLHVFILVNAAYSELVGERELIGKPMREALPEAEGQGFLALLDRVYASGEAFVGSEVRVLIQRRPDTAPDEHFLDFVYQPIVEADGQVSGIFIQGVDITERKRAETRQRLLMDELNHRVKNTLATVQAIAAQTARTAISPQAFRETFEARLIALSHTHNALTRGHWESADLHELLEQQLRPHDDLRVTLTGEPVRLPPRIALTLGMVLHELATNAAKHGALAVDDGHVHVVWRKERSGRDGDAVLRLDWTETGGPPVSPPARRGFGSMLIERSLASETDGEARLEFLPDGVRCRLVVAL